MTNEDREHMERYSAGAQAQADAEHREAQWIRAFNILDEAFVEWRTQHPDRHLPDACRVGRLLYEAYCDGIWARGAILVGKTDDKEQRPVYYRGRPLYVESDGWRARFS